MSADRDPLRAAFLTELQSLFTSLSITEGADWQLVDTVNTTANPDAGHPYIDIDFVGGSEDQLTTGAPGSNVFREDGQITLAIHVPLGKQALQKSTELKIRAIRNALRLRRIDVDGGNPMRIGRMQIMGGGQDEGGMWVETLGIEYRTDNIG